VLLAGGLNASQETQPKASKDFVNVNLHNIHDLTGPVIRSKTLIHIESSANKPLKEYSIVLPSKDVSKVLSFFQVAQKDSPKATEQPLKLVKDKDGVTYKAVLKQPLGPKESTYLVVNSVYTGMLKPTPQEVAQDERQFLELAGNVYFYSPYESKKQKTTVRWVDLRAALYSNNNSLSNAVLVSLMLKSRRVF
jgi:oligosaccharyltransferase complex subunit alpha (ribophorin I)